MRRLCIGLGFSVMALMASGAAQAGPTDATFKMDPGMRAELALSRRSMVSMFVKTNDLAATRAEIARLGGTIGTVSGDIVTVRMPTGSVTKMAQSTSVLRLEAARKVTARLEKLLPETKADQVHAGAAGTPFKGAGVVVGVIDYGLDLTHQAFQKAGGASRVVGLWDQQATGTPPQGYTYGSECTAAQLAGNTCAHSDTGTHGTHVTGIAAGGPVAGVPYLGMAPEADIAFVHLGSAPGATTGNEGLTTAICDGAAYIFKVAGALGKPAVINMSLGEHSGPHDGTSLADQCLDNLTGPGKILVAAAGNEGQGSQSAAAGNPAVFVHAGGMSSANPSTARFSADTKGAVELGVWFDSPADLTVRIGVIDGNGNTAFTTPISRTQQLAQTMLTVGGVTVGPMAGGGGELPGGARGVQFQLTDGNNDMAELNQVQWILEVTGAGRFDAFIDTTGQSGFVQGNLGAGLVADSAMTIGFPAIANKVIAVGSYVTRNEWTPLTGGAQTQTSNGQQVVVGALSGFSSRGPARRPGVVTQKPEIAAPGEIVIAPLNSKGKPAAERVMKASPNGYVLSEGTSMASPAVAGAIALMLQKNPRLTVEDVKKALASSATPVAGETLPSTNWGAGKLNALGAVQAVSGGAPPVPGTDGGTPPPGDTDGGAPPGATPPAATPAGSSGGCSQATPVSPTSWLSVGGLVLALAAGLRRARRK